jgi:hypothetical protein
MLKGSPLTVTGAVIIVLMLLMMIFSPWLCIFGVCYGSQIYKAHSAWQIFAASLLRLVLVDNFYIITP